LRAERGGNRDCRWGAAALKLWQSIVPTLAQAGASDLRGNAGGRPSSGSGGLHHLAERVEHAGFGAHLQWLHREDIAELEPELEGRFSEGLYLAPEGEIDPRSLLPAWSRRCGKTARRCISMTEVEAIASGAITVARGAPGF
jgi:glycine oxidase